MKQARAGARMGKTNFQYDESGNTFYYFLLTFLSFILFPSTYYFWPQEEKVKLDFAMLLEGCRKRT